LTEIPTAANGPAVANGRVGAVTFVVTDRDRSPPPLNRTPQRLEFSGNTIAEGTSERQNELEASTRIGMSIYPP